MKKLLILDANSIVNRAFYAVRTLTNKDGLNTNAIFGFLNIFFKYQEEISPDYIAAAFDLPAPTFRHKMFDGYKATRHKMPDELREQIPVLKDVLRAMNIKIYEKEGYEADDIIGTTARVCEEENICCCILTGDRDDLQLASENVLIHLVTTRMGNTQTEVFDDKKVYEKYGVTPKEFIDLKAIMGDSSDNIPGVRGIGEKGATSLVTEFHSLDGIYENIESEKISKSVREKLIAEKETAYLSKTLATIDKNVPLDINVSETLKSDYNDVELFNIFTKLEFRSFIKKLGLKGEVSATAEKQSFDSCEFRSDLKKDELKKLLKAESVIFTTDENADVIAFTLDGKTAYSAEFKGNEDVFKDFFEGEAKKSTHSLKDLILKFKEKEINIQNVNFDTQIGAYLLQPSRKGYDLSEISFDILGLSIEEEKGGEQLSLDSLLEEKTDNTSLMKKAIAIYMLKAYEEDEMRKKELLSLFENIEMPLVYVLASMEEAGVTVDKERLKEFGKMLSLELDKLTNEIYEEAGHEFNINSPKQLGTVLFEELGLKSGKKTKSGYSTGAEVLEKLKNTHPIVDKVLEYRKIAKLNSTYVDGLIAVINEKTGRIHSSFNQTVTVTGRISSTEPNLQNIPVRTKLGREMRKMFVAPSPDYVLVDADYSQIELRVLAHISDDENMINAFVSGEDIHASTAARVFNVSKEDVTGEMRSAAKAINFGLVYGMGEFSLSQDLHISVKAAKDYIEDYLGSYPKVRQYMKDTVDFAKENAYVKTMFGRRRDLPEIQASNYQVRSFGERAAMNTPVQGSAADIIKLAMINVDKRLKKENLKSRLILQVHDELIVEALNEELEKVCAVLKEEMEEATKLSVPLKADMKWGHSWYDTK